MTPSAAEKSAVALRTAGRGLPTGSVGGTVMVASVV